MFSLYFQTCQCILSLCSVLFIFTETQQDTKIGVNRISHTHSFFFFFIAVLTFSPFHIKWKLHVGEIVSFGLLLKMWQKMIYQDYSGMKFFLWNAREELIALVSENKFSISNQWSEFSDTIYHNFTKFYMKLYLSFSKRCKKSGGRNYDSAKPLQYGK